jgi:hypothetical protein
MLNPEPNALDVGCAEQEDWRTIEKIFIISRLVCRVNLTLEDK